MTKEQAHEKSEDQLLELVQREDPLAGTASPYTEAGSERLIRKILAPSRESASDRRSFMTRPKTLLVAAAAVAVVTAGGVGVAFASGFLGGSDGVRAAQSIGESSGVNGLQTLVTSDAGHANVVEGNQSGATVATVTVGSFAGPYIAVAQVLADRDLIVRTGSGGSAGSVGWIAAAGLVSDRVARVDLLSKSGDVKPADLSSGAFAVEVGPAFEPDAIVAYDRDGKEVARASIPDQAAPKE